MKEYLGDGVYAEWRGWDLELYTSNGMQKLQTIYLDEGVLANLQAFLKRLRNPAMPRPRNTVRTVYVHIKLPEPLMSRVYAVLDSELLGKLPFGAQQAFFTRAAEDLLAKLEGEPRGT